MILPKTFWLVWFMLGSLVSSTIIIGFLLDLGDPHSLDRILARTPIVRLLQAIYIAFTLCTITGWFWMFAKLLS